MTAGGPWIRLKDRQADRRTRSRSVSCRRWWPAVGPLDSNGVPPPVRPRKSKKSQRHLIFRAYVDITATALVRSFVRPGRLFYRVRACAAIKPNFAIYVVLLLLLLLPNSMKGSR